MLPASYFTRIVQPITFEDALAPEGEKLHVIGRDSRGEACYCHFACRFECPRSFVQGRQRRGAESYAASARELRAWRLHGGRWLLCVIDAQPGSDRQRTRYSTRTEMPASVCLDEDCSE